MPDVSLGKRLRNNRFIAGLSIFRKRCIYQKSPSGAFLTVNSTAVEFPLGNIWEQKLDQQLEEFDFKLSNPINGNCPLFGLTVSLCRHAEGSMRISLTMRAAPPHKDGMAASPCQSPRKFPASPLKRPGGIVKVITPPIQEFPGFNSTPFSLPD